MKIIQAKSGEGYAVRAYQTGQIIINDQIYTQSLIITPDQLITDWPPQTPAELTEAHFEPFLELRPELVLLGTGEKQAFPPIALYATLLQEHIGVEVMNTGAACRTFNILAAEGRKVAAAIMMV